MFLVWGTNHSRSFTQHKFLCGFFNRTTKESRLLSEAQQDPCCVISCCRKLIALSTVLSDEVADQIFLFLLSQRFNLCKQAFLELWPDHGWDFVGQRFRISLVTIRIRTQVATGKIASPTLTRYHQCNSRLGRNRSSIIYLFLCTPLLTTTNNINWFETGCIPYAKYVLEKDYC